jgi:hypothetical protein
MTPDEWFPTLAHRHDVVPVYAPGQEWRDYVRQLEAANYTDCDVPSADDYETFQEWADVFYRNNA